jgi:predicted DNA-binding transcriptional regulator AlpA
LNQLLKPQELAALFGVPVSFIYDRTCRSASDPIPRIKIGKYVRFDPEQVESWLRHHDGLTNGSVDRESHLTSSK